MQFEKWATLDIGKGRAATLDLGPILFMGDINPLKVGVELIGSEGPTAVEGEVAGWAVCADGSTSAPFEDTGKEGNRAWIIVPQGALAVPGKVEIFLQITQTDASGTTAAVTLYAYGYVKRAKTDTVINPGDPIPNVGAIEAVLSACQTATQNATEAANHAVQYDAAQTLTTQQQTQAKINIGAALETAVLLPPPATDGRINTSGDIGDTIDLTPILTSGYFHEIEECSPGDVFTVRGRAPGTSTSWMCFLDANNGKLLAVPASANFTTVTAPENAAKVIRQYRATAESKDNIWYSGIPLIKRIEDLEAAIAAINA